MTRVRRLHYMPVAQYVAHLTLAGYRPRTIDARRHALEALDRHLGAIPILAATRPDLAAWLARPLAPESRRAYRSHVCQFFAWCLDEGLVKEDPSAKLPAIRVPRAVPRPIGDAELSAALSRADARMRAWLLLMALGGLRCCEVAALRPADLLITEAGVLLFLREAKGGGQGTVPAHAAIIEALAQIPIRGRTWWDCSPAHVSRQVSVFMASCGIAATAHQLRHYAGTHWYSSSGHDLLATAALLRHANVATTQRYAQMDPVRPAEVVNLVRSPIVLPSSA